MISRDLHLLSTSAQLLACSPKAVLCQICPDKSLNNHANDLCLSLIGHFIEAITRLALQMTVLKHCKCVCVCVLCV
jgi:hypothetical protein